jgi:hypothetical protein
MLLLARCAFGNCLTFDDVNAFRRVTRVELEAALAERMRPTD